MLETSARWLPRLLMPDQQLTRLTWLILKQTNQLSWPFLPKDECWVVHQFETETKRQSMQLKEPWYTHKKGKGRLFSKEGGGISFHGCIGHCIHRYMGIIMSICWSSCEKQLRLRPGNYKRNVVLSGKSACSNNLLSQWLLGITLVVHPPYILDLAPSVFFCFRTWTKGPIRRLLYLRDPRTPALLERKGNYVE